MTRGGHRAGSGRKSDADTPRSVRFEFKLTPAQDWWLDHLATSAKLSRAAVIAAALDRAISAHTCSECNGTAACVDESPTQECFDANATQDEPVTKTEEPPP